MRNFNVNVEYSWNDFRNLNHVKDLPINEQVKQYHFYLDRLSNERMNQPKGPGKQVEVQVPVGSFLLTENGAFLVQEDGSKIKI